MTRNNVPFGTRIALQRRSHGYQMEDLKNTATIQQKQVPSSKHKQRVHQSRKIHWEIIAIFKIQADAKRQPRRKRPIKRLLRTQTSVNVKEGTSWRLIVRETKCQGSKTAPYSIV
ncbi:hypothetical protein AVEN_693-1 [Araneus ventricosus]|uniref:Uncharacterized protein n=1 Tax=Araneus ventricosus TaxID=182803 RepID=A0A4Y2BWR8_ARAVE|nr:hypothetical protein AVEN_693-1 [Araneus ventricosus]